MRARLKFKSDDMTKEAITSVLQDHLWWPQFAQDSDEATRIADDVQASVDHDDEQLFKESKKLILRHENTESRGTISLEHGVWVLRILSSDIHLLRLACEALVSHFVVYVDRNRKHLSFVGHVQIVELRSKEPIITGQVLATKEGRKQYARAHKGLERKIGLFGITILIILLILTSPLGPRHDSGLGAPASNPTPWISWALSAAEKLIGSVAVTALLALVQYWTFRSSLREDTVRWSIPGEWGHS